MPKRKPKPKPKRRPSSKPAASDRSPAKQAKGAGRGGNVPPAETRFQPGESGNPKGRPPAGLKLREWINVFAQQDLTAKQLKVIARDPEGPWHKRAAAERVLRTLEAPDITEFEPWLTGEKTMKELKAEGVNTEAVKKKKITDKGGREIELYDRAGEDFDRIMDRTEGKARQRLELEVEHKQPDVLSDAQYVAFALAKGIAADKWVPGVRARYEAGMVPGYPKKEKKK